MHRFPTLTALLATACAKSAAPTTGAETERDATAVLTDRQGAAVAEVRLSESEHGLVMVVEGSGLEPLTKHGFHVHEGSYCGPDLQGAEGHCSPDGRPHGGPHAPDDAHHAGDLGNLVTTASGDLSETVLAEDLSLDDGDHPVLGRTMVLHKGADDLSSQPSGSSGGRLACRVIRPDDA